MSTYSIYIKEEADEALKKAAKSLGITAIELIKKRLEQAEHLTTISALQSKMNAMFFLFELMISEVGFTSGATRAACANSPVAIGKGNELELGLKKMVAEVKAQLEKQGAEVSL